MKKNFKKPIKKFNKKNTKTVYQKQIKDIDFKLKTVNLVAQISRVIQTGGPTIFVAIDGTGTLSLKGFVSPGERAFSQIHEGDCVKSLIEIGEFQGEIEGNPEAKEYRNP